MSQHLKTQIITSLSNTIAKFVSLPPFSCPRARGVRYFELGVGIDCLWGAMNDLEEGRKYKKHIIVRRVPRCHELLQLYTYHFPTHWSAACVANRELIKLAQRRAHDLEHANTREALEWKLRFFHHYYTVCKGGAKPEPGLKRYTRFYQYTYVSIYRQLQAERQKTSEIAEDVSFDSIDLHPLQTAVIRRPVLRSATRPALCRAFLLQNSA